MKKVFIIVEVPGIEAMSEGDFWKSMLVESIDEVFSNKSKAIKAAQARFKQLWIDSYETEEGCQEAVDNPTVENNYIAYAMDPESSWYVVIYELELKG